MALRSNATLEAFVSKIICNEEIMNILHLPVINKNDNEITKRKKRKTLIDKVITKTSQAPYELNKSFPPISIDGKEYKDYSDIRMTVAFAQSIKMDSYLFGNPQVEINIYYDNTKMEDVFKLLDLISDEFSGQNLEVETETEKHLLRELKCEGITAQVAIINNFERIGIRFSFYATIYKN